jgi:general nucleoside transport system permease protein
MLDLLQGVLDGGVRAGTPILYATLGEVVAERAGVVNLGVEGMILAGACAGFVTTALTQSPLLGVAAAAAAGGLASLVHAFMVVTVRANQIASGLALMFLCLGVTSFVGRPWVGVKINAIPALAGPRVAALPVLGRLLGGHDALVWGAYLLAPVIWAFLFRTHWGLALRAVGERQTVAYASGLPTALIRYGAVATGGVLSGLAGAHLSLAYARSWVEGMSNGRGFIAVALVIFATWHPLRAVVGAVAFGAVFALQLQIQARGVAISPYFLDMTPYLLTLLGLLLLGRTQRHTLPEGLTEVFEGQK